MQTSFGRGGDAAFGWCDDRSWCDGAEQLDGGAGADAINGRRVDYGPIHCRGRAIARFDPAASGEAAATPRAIEGLIEPVPGTLEA